MTEIFNLHTLCRCCHSDGSFKSLQLSYAHDNRIEVYSTMLKETLDVTISPPPFEASYAICDSCINRLRDAAHFKQQVLDCELKFEEYCKNEQALTLKEEIDYESSTDYDLGRHNENVDVYDNEGVQYEKGADEKFNIKIKEIKSCEASVLCEDVDEKYSVKIKEENEDVPPKSIQQTIPIEYVRTDKARPPVSDRILTKHGLKDRVRRKQAYYSVDPELESHVKTENGDSFICKTCNKPFKMLKLLRRHIVKQHRDAYKCPDCSLQCSGRLHFLRHRKTHGINAPFKCHLCEKSFRSKYTLKLHINVHTKTEKFQCDICHKMFNYKQTLKKHILWHYGATKKCICDICGNGFNDMANLNIHIRVVHEKQRPFKCPLCAKTFTANKNLKQHSYFHTGIKPYKCEVCSDTFGTSWRLRHHQIKYHPKSSAGPGRAGKKRIYTCKVCKLQLESRGKFMSHLRGHVGHKEYKCHMCVKDFSCKYSLNRHIASHSGLKPYSCDLCDKKYTQQSLLCRHKKRIHDPNSPSYEGRLVERVKCDLCNRSFRNMKKHMVSHKSRPHVCEFCRKSYPERNTLNRHILLVHKGLRQHPCTLCDKKYTRWDGLQRHTRKVHKLELKREVEES